MIARIATATILFIYLIITMASLSVVKEKARDKADFFNRLGVWVLFNIAFLLLFFWIVQG